MGGKTQVDGRADLADEPDLTELDAAADLVAGLQHAAIELVLPLPVTVPVNVPPTRYSREETAVVSGATGS